MAVNWKVLHWRQEASDWICAKIGISNFSLSVMNSRDQKYYKHVSSRGEVYVNIQESGSSVQPDLNLGKVIENRGEQEMNLQNLSKWSVF